MDPETKKNLRQAGSLSAVGLEMGIAVAIGFVLGHWLDRRFDTEPVLTGVFLFFGLAAAGLAVYRAYKTARDIDDPDKEKD